jgi:hypothetical protein
VTCLCILCGTETTFLGTGAEAVVGEGWGDDVEGGAVGYGEEGEDVLDFEEGTGPWGLVSRCFL